MLGCNHLNCSAFFGKQKGFFSLSQGGSKGNAQFRSSVCTVTTIYIPGRRKGGGIRENKVITSWHINVMMLQTSKNVTWSSDTVQTENILAKHSISYLTTQFLFVSWSIWKHQGIASVVVLVKACRILVKRFKAVSLMKAEKWCNRNLTALCALCISYKLPNQQARGEQQPTLQSLQQAVSKRYGIWVPERSNYRHENVMCVGSNHPKLSHTHSIYIAVPL